MSFEHYIKKIWSEISALQKHTKGQGVKVAILDGPIDTSHPCFMDSQITFTGNNITPGLATMHGTHVASIMLANSVDELKGVCPEVECISVPIFREHKNGNIIPSSQFELARAIETALNAGADIINISAGEKVRAAEPQKRLEKIIERCIENQVLLVSAVGNNGCPCIHVPAVHPNVLAVGALDHQGFPMAFSNWGEPYQFNGVMAPGEGIRGAMPGGTYAERSGTSFATPIVSGVIALLYSYFKNKLHPAITPLSIREAILNTSYDCPLESGEEEISCDRFLKGILNISGAMKYLERMPVLAKDLEISSPSNKLKSNANRTKTVRATDISLIPNYTQKQESANWVVPSEYRIRKQIRQQLVYAVGTLDVDFETDAVLDSFKFYMRDLIGENGKPFNFPDPYNPNQLSVYLSGQSGSTALNNIYEAGRVTWVLKQNDTPIYAIKPAGPFSEEAYQLLIRFLKPVEKAESDQPAHARVSLCSVPGHIIGQSKLRSGAIIPTVQPNIRAMYNWKIIDLVEHVSRLLKKNNRKMDEKQVLYLIDRLANRLAFKMENIGLSAADRALNHATTNLYNLGDTFVKKLSHNYELDDIQIERSKHCRPDSDCQDVIISFFKPSDRLGSSRHVFRFTIDVSAVIPVAVGEVQEWFDY